MAVREFWGKFVVDLAKAGDEMISYKAGIPTGKTCEKCGQGELLERISRHGFLSGLLALPGLRLYSGYAPELGRRRREQKRNIARTAAKRNAAEAVDDLARFLARAAGIRIARRRGRLVEGTRIGTSRMSPWKKSAPCVGNHLIKTKHGRFGEFIGCSGSEVQVALGRLRWGSSARSAATASSCGEAAPVKAGGDGRAFSTGARDIPDCDFTTPLTADAGAVS